LVTENSTVSQSKTSSIVVWLTIIMKWLYLSVWTSLLRVSSAFLGSDLCAVPPKKSHGPTAETTVGRPHSRTSTTSTTTCLYDAPEPLAEEGTWQAFLDEEKTGLIYYFDIKTGESLWEPPTSTFPEVRLPRRKQRLADSLRQEYRNSRQKEMMGGYNSQRQIGDQLSSSSITIVAETETKDDTEGGPQQQQQSWMESIFDVEKDTPPKKKVDREVVPKEESQRDWFSFFDDGKRKDQDGPQTVTESVEEPPKRDWFGGMLGARAKPDGTDSRNQQVETPGTTTVKDKGKKIGISMIPLAQPSPQQQEATATSTTTPVEKRAEPAVEEKPTKTKDIERVVEVPRGPIKIEIGSHILPHPAKIKWGGEDAVFVKGRSFGVFDGVSGADKLDGVPLYSRTLANEMKRMVGNNGVTVQEMTTYMTNAAAYADGAATGASTAVVASIGENGFLQALNIGDSYCMVVRDGKVSAKTREISHYWECPYQLSEDSPDRPRDGTKLNVELIPGDVIIMGSDGVFDNVSDDSLLDLVAKCPPKPTLIAKKICDLSRKQSLDKNSITPYGKQAQRRGDPDYRNGLGGKLDDVSAIVVICK
jgi:protein phosphatase PTC7